MNWGAMVRHRNEYQNQVPIESPLVEGERKECCGDSSEVVSHLSQVNRGGVVEFGLGSHTVLVVALDSSSGTEGFIAADELARFTLADCTYAVVCKHTIPSALAAAPAEVLSRRELQIAALVAEGKLNKQIADLLHISEWTVCAHLRRIFAKLGVSTRAAMVYRCASVTGMRKATTATSLERM
jgi:DNA-binding CsgD family transcriptional regulator